MTASIILDLIQEAIGEPVGGFYNISTRLAHMNRAQNDMVREAGALSKSSTVPYIKGEGADLPPDFLDFGPQQSTVDVSGRFYPLTSTSLADLQNLYPTRFHPIDGTPEKMYVLNDKVLLYPEASQVTTLNLSYVARPLPMETDADEPFNGGVQNEEAAWGIVYYVAAQLLRPRNPDLAAAYDREYRDALAQLRQTIQNTKQSGGSFIRPFGYFGGH